MNWQWIWTGLSIGLAGGAVVLGFMIMLAVVVVIARFIFD